MSQPYAVNPPGTEPGFRGYHQIADAVLQAAFERWWRSGVQINRHMNGDAAAEQALRAIEAVVQRQGRADYRPVFIHASYLRPDQTQRMKAVSPQPWVLALVDAGVNRRTPAGLVIGPAERVNHYRALQAVTSHPGWQIKEERSKGTLAVGKLADLVILERNPLTVDSATIKDIAVLATTKEGRTIFRRDPATASARDTLKLLLQVRSDRASQP